MAQRNQRPVPITKINEEVPDELAAILDKMLAKEVADRYQTPAEVVTALTGLSRATPPRAGVEAAGPKPAAPTKFSFQTLSADGDETVGRVSRKVVVRCPFCQAEIRVSRRKLGESMQRRAHLLFHGGGIARPECKHRA